MVFFKVVVMSPLLVKVVISYLTGDFMIQGVVPSGAVVRPHYSRSHLISSVSVASRWEYGHLIHPYFICFSSKGLYTNDWHGGGGLILNLTF